MRRPLVITLALLVFAVTWWRLSPGQAGDGDFDLARARQHLEVVAGEPHPVDSEANARVRAYIVSQLESLRLPVTVEQDEAFSRAGNRVTVHNIITRIEGTRGDGPVLLLACHYDSHARGQGAGDDGAAVASVLVTARELTKNPPTNDVILLITDGEEAGLLGAEAWAARHGETTDARIVLNFEARGTSGPSVMFQTSEGNAKLVDLYAQVVRRPVTSSLGGGVYRLMPNNTDFTIFQRVGLEGLNFAFIGDVTNYHQVTDTPEAISDATLLHQGSQMLALARAFGNADLVALTTDARDAIYFDVLSVAVVRYPGWLAWPTALLAAVVTGATLWRRVDRSAVVFSLAWCAGLVAGLVAWWELWTIALPRSAFIRFEAISFLLIAFVSGAAAAWIAARGDARGRLAGLGAGLSLLGLITTSVIPEGGYVFVLPALFTGTSALLWRRAAWVTILAAVAVTVLLVPLAWMVYQAFAGRPAPPAVVMAIVAFAWVVAVRAVPETRGESPAAQE